MSRIRHPHVVSEFWYREQPGRWRFVLDQPLTIRFPLDHWGKHAFHDEKGTCWVRTEGSDWIISAGYAWDGSSPKFFAWGRHWGTPDFHSTRAASAWHDAAGQFRHLLCIADKLPGSLWNRRFADIIRGEGSPAIAALYGGALAIGNPFYNLAGRVLGAKPSGNCSEKI